MRKVLISIIAAFGLMLGGGAYARSAYMFDFTSIEGTPLSLDGYRGKAVLVVNTASRCGFTPQYAGLQSLWEKYRDRGLVVLGVPSNDFGAQEPGSEGEIKSFCEINFDIDFPMTAKEVVSGDNAHPFYKWSSEALGGLSKPRWNFHKILLDTEGNAVDWFAPTTTPNADKLISAIEAVLPG